MVVVALFLLIQPAFPIDTEHIIDLTHRCKTCHPSVFNQWGASMHAKAADDPWVISMYNGSDIPGLNLRSKAKQGDVLKY